MKQTLTFQDAMKFMYKDIGGVYRYNHPISEHYAEVQHYREATKQYRFAHVKPLLSKKFAKWLQETYPNSATEFGLLIRKRERVETEVKSDKAKS